MKIALYIVFEYVQDIDCPHYEPYSSVDAGCKHSIPPCSHLPQSLYQKYDRLLDFHGAYGFLCYGPHQRAKRCATIK